MANTIHPMAMAGYFVLLIPPFMMSIFLLAILYKPRIGFRLGNDFGKLLLLFILPLYLILCLPAGVAGFIIGLSNPQSPAQIILYSATISMLVTLTPLYVVDRKSFSASHPNIRIFLMLTTLLAILGGVTASVFLYR